MSWILFNFLSRRLLSWWKRLVGRLFHSHNTTISLFKISSISSNKNILKAKTFFFQVATDKCIMFFLFLIVCGVIAIIIVKVLPLFFVWSSGCHDFSGSIFVNLELHLSSSKIIMILDNKFYYMKTYHSVPRESFNWKPNKSV